MLTSALDGLSRLRLEWPEALIIDLLADCYAPSAKADGLSALARLHARFLREVMEGEPRRAAALRLEVIAHCAGSGIDVATIEKADRLVFDELRRITQSRFRNSPRLLATFHARLDDAMARVPSRLPPPSPTRLLVEAVARPVVRRSPLRLSPLPA